MRLFLGVDGGQTTTKVVLGNADAQIVAQATGGPSNHTEEPGGPERLEAVVKSTVAQVLASVHAPDLKQVEFTAACFGMTGEVEIKRRILQKLIRTTHLSVVHDSVNALIGATAGAPGINVIAGTGSVARGMDCRGRELCVGGWGYQFGDEGSAYRIGVEAVQSISAESDGLCPKTMLTEIFLGRLGVASASELRARYYSGTWPRDHLAGLAPWVTEAAESGDAAALRILEKAGEDLAGFVRSILQRLFPPALSSAASDGRSSRGPLVCYSGGVFHSRFVLASFENSIARERHEVLMRPALLPPVLGSLLLAYRDLGIEVQQETYLEWLETVCA